MMKLLSCLVVMVACVQELVTRARTLQTDVDKGVSIDTVFTRFKQIYNKTYTDQYEEAMRRSIFEVNVNHIKAHNKLYAKGEKSYTLGVNQFTDLTHQEFLKLYTGHILKPKGHNTNASTYLAPANILLPGQVDWREKGYVTKVKNQLRCGSCWSFSATGSVEGQHFRKTGQLIPLSEQQLVDCSGSYGNSGCNGGLMDYAFEYIKDKGIEAETDYPYEGVESSCKYNKNKVKATVTGYKDIARGDENALQSALATVGPISIAIDASNPSFQSYSGGVYDETMCSSTKLDHGVLVVGYGTYASSDYWLVKNSWGETWGEGGYIKMSRNKDNQCGVATQASYPLV